MELDGPGPPPPDPGPEADALYHVLQQYLDEWHKLGVQEARLVIMDFKSSLDGAALWARFREVESEGELHPCVKVEVRKVVARLFPYDSSSDEADGGGA
jgi:hypothetical protein